MFEEMGEKALAKLVHEGRDPSRDLRLGQIAFDYLPASPLEHGWTLRDTNNPPLFSTNERRGLTISARERYALDCEPQPPSGLCGRMRLSAKYSADGVFYVKVRMGGRDDQSSKVGWLAFRLGNGSPKRETHDEWIVYIAESKTDGWFPLNIPLQYYVGQTYGSDQRLVYQELLAVRLRGSLSVSPIQFFR